MRKQSNKSVLSPCGYSLRVISHTFSLIPFYGASSPRFSHFLCSSSYGVLYGGIFTHIHASRYGISLSYLLSRPSAHSVSSFFTYSIYPIRFLKP